MSSENMWANRYDEDLPGIIHYRSTGEFVIRNPTHNGIEYIDLHVTTQPGAARKAKELGFNPDNMWFVNFSKIGMINQI